MSQNSKDHLEQAEIIEKLGDYRWRMDNLYYILDEKGNKVRFKMNDIQRLVIDDLWFLNLIVKARQLGMTTFFTLFYLDQILFSENKTACIIAHREEDMKKIFRKKIVFALDNMDPWVRKYVSQTKSSTANEIVFENGGIISVSLSTRSDTVNYLHISEFGKICAKFPEKANEIMTGAINSVHAGQMISIESTAEGREGHFFRLAMEAEKMRKEKKELTPLDFKIHFFPWWMDGRYTMSEKDTARVTIDTKLAKYFQDLEGKDSILLTAGQKAWYTKKLAMLAEGVKQEFPSTLDEAFAVSLESVYYAEEMNNVYAQKRIGFFPYDPQFDVDTVWDLGMNDENVMLFFQQIGPEIRFIDYHSASGNGLDHYVKVLREKPYKYGRHILPHDATVRDLSAVGGVTRQQILWELGLTNTIVAHKAGRADGIEKVRMIFPRFRFNEVTTKTLTDHLASYQKQWVERLGVWGDNPKHDRSSHSADAVRTLAVVYMEPSYGLDMDGNMTHQDVNIQSFAF